MNLDNVMTHKTKGINIPFDGKISLVNVPSNEDWAMVVEVTTVEGNIIKGKKIWDGKENIFEAKNICNGYAEIGQHVIFYRTAEGFICILPLSWIFVQDLGNKTGQEVNFLADGSTQLDLNSPILPLKATDSIAKFHNGNPPFKEGRIYFAQKTQNCYLVWLNGFGEKTYTPEIELDIAKIKLHCDNQGNLIDVSYEDTGQQDDFWVRNLELWWTYLYNASYQGDMGRIYLNIAGEELDEYKNKMQKKEIFIYSPDFSTYLSTMLKSQRQGSGTYNYFYPLKWSFNAYKNFALELQDYYEENKILARSVEPPTTGLSRFADMPGSGVFPPVGCLEDTAVVQYRCKEFYTDGITRFTQKDSQSNIFYEERDSQEIYPILCACSGYVPYPRSIGWHQFFKDDAYFYLGVKKRINPTRSIPTQYGLINNAIYTVYAFEDDLSGGSSYANYVLVSAQNAEWCEDDFCNENYIGSVIVPRRNWGFTVGGGKRAFILVIYYKNAEIWCPWMTAQYL